MTDTQMKKLSLMVTMQIISANQGISNLNQENTDLVLQKLEQELAALQEK
ncbi:MAG: hypothetical protein FWE36_07925 [Erysipelotrichales bacterium]|nr:hypothetical protein [Erysipelotrichales bacterium]